MAPGRATFVPMPTVMEIAALHRYFLQANRMRTLYYERLRDEGAAEVDSDLWTGQAIDLSLWYGCLFVVVEGWRDLGLADERVDSLLGSEGSEMLRRFRNGVFHYQRSYWDDRFVAFLKQGAKTALWARQLNEEFGRFFLEWFRTSRLSSAG